WHWPLEQTLSTQSAGCWHVFPASHLAHIGPPQSTSLSPLLRMPSLHEGTHTPPLQLPLAQSDAAPQCFPSAQRMHMPAPPPSMSLSPPFLIPSMQFGATQALLPPRALLQS